MLENASGITNVTAVTVMTTRRKTARMITFADADNPPVVEEVRLLDSGVGSAGASIKKTGGQKLIRPPAQESELLRSWWRRYRRTRVAVVIPVVVVAHGTCEFQRVEIIRCGSGEVPGKRVRERSARGPPIFSVPIPRAAHELRGLIGGHHRGRELGG